VDVRLGAPVEEFAAGGVKVGGEWIECDELVAGIGVKPATAWLGDARGADEETIDGEPAERDFAVTWKTRGRPVAGLLVNRPRARRAAPGHDRRSTSMRYEIRIDEFACAGHGDCAVVAPQSSAWKTWPR